MFGSDNSTPHLAATYDEQVQVTIPCYDVFHQQTLNIIKAACMNPKLWLDTGCGTGTLAQKTAAEFPEAKLVLVDPSRGMLEAAKKKLTNQANVEFLDAAPTQNLCNLNKAFDVITTIQSHHYLSPTERAKATEVCHKLLEPKGMFITFENIRPFTPEGAAIGKQYWGSFQLSQGRDAQAVEEHMKRFGVEYFPLTIEEHLRLYRKTGFSVVEMLWYSYMQAGFYCIK